MIVTEILAEHPTSFTGSVSTCTTSIDVYKRQVLARPDLTTFQLLPWYEEGAGVARVFCDIVNIDGTPFDGCPRQQLRRVLGEARGQGYTFFVAPEIEYFYFEGLDTSSAPVPIDHGSYFDLLPDDTASQLRRRTVLTLEEMGIGVEHAQHEDAPGQHEIDLRYTDALTMGAVSYTHLDVYKRQALVSTSAGIGSGSPSFAARSLRYRQSS